MHRTNYRNLAAALLVAGSLGLAGHDGNTAHAQSMMADCGDPAMMMDPNMESPMMGDKMNDPAMMMDDPAMMGDQGMAMPMMGSMMLRARDGQCLASQTAQVQAAFTAAWGDGAGARWVQEHEAALARSGM